ncbi:CoA transferase [Paenarthrobacter sp. NPDC089316]|uniref:CoA transferase n=1 Tax=unclassified Paenarthrobacter TaxID=2634190 RepID=UPI00342FE5BF
MSISPLAGLRIVEFASFVAGPSAGMALAQLGAEVIRIDPLTGGPDIRRWPLSRETGASLYWSSLNRGKKSVTIDVRSPEGQELVLALATRPGSDAGILVDNQVGRPWLSHGALAARRPDAIRMHIAGRADGGPAVDYTVNPDVGVADLTGPGDSRTPINHVLPAWDYIAGMTAVMGLLAAVRRRDRTGEGADLKIALADVALAGVANLGWLSEAREYGDRARHGNYMYGTFGVDFKTVDGQRIMVVALTPRQWVALGRATGTRGVLAALEESLSVDFSREDDRYLHREVIAAVMRPWFASSTSDAVASALTEEGVLWSRYRTMTEVVADFAAGGTSGVLADVDQPGIGSVISARSPILEHDEYGSTATAPALGADTDEVLSAALGLSSAELARLHDAGVLCRTGAASSH